MIVFGFPGARRAALASAATLSLVFSFGCGDEESPDPRVCGVGMSFVRSETVSSGDNRSSSAASSQLVYQGPLDSRCVHLVEGATGGYTYEVAANFLAFSSLRQVDFGGGRTESFPRATGYEGGAGRFFVSVDRRLDSPSTKTNSTTESSTVAGRRYALPWLDGTRLFEVRFEVPERSASDLYPSAVTLTLRLPPVEGKEK